MTLLAALLFAIHVPNGLHVSVFARDLEQPRTLLVLDDGTLLVSRPMLNDVLALRDRDGDGRADEIRTAVSSVEGARGLAMHGTTLYVAGAKSIVSAERHSDGSFGEPIDVADDLYGAAAIGAGPDGKLYVSRDAMLMQLDDDGANRRVFARGAGNVSAFAWDPKTRELWGTEETGGLHRIGDGVREPAALQVPEESIALAFHDNSAFAASRDAIVHVEFEDGKPRRAEDFISGVHASGLAVARDGTLLFSDDESGIVYRVSKLPPPMTSNAPSDLRSSILSKAFHLDGLQRPVSVVHDEEQDVYFVASASGFISRVTPDGTIADPKFVDGLRTPKGMAILGTQLWIADGAKLRVVDRVSGADVRTIDLAARGAVSLSGVAAGGDDAIYVTDTDVRTRETHERVRAGDGRIFRVTGDAIEIAIAGEELHSPSAIAWDGMRFLVAQGYGHDVLAWSPGGGTKAVMRGPGSYDGIVVLPNGSVIVSSEFDEALHVGFGSGELRPLFTRKPSPAAIGFDRKRNRLLVPSVEGNWLEAWTLPPMERPQTTSRAKKHDVAAYGLRRRQSPLSASVWCAPLARLGKDKGAPEARTTRGGGGVTTSPSPVPSAEGPPGMSSTTR